MTSSTAARRTSVRRSTARHSTSTTVTLRTVGDALRQMQVATLTQLAADLAAPPREVEAMLAFWERRGNVRRCQTQAALGCGTACHGCPVGSGGPPSRDTSSGSIRLRIRPFKRRGVRSPADATRDRHSPAPVVYEWVGECGCASGAGRQGQE